MKFGKKESPAPPQPEMHIEQLRGVVQSRIAELSGYKYMEQALLAVERAEERVAEAEKYFKDLQERCRLQNVELGRLEAMTKNRAAEEDARHATRVENHKQEIDKLRDDLTKKKDQLDSWQKQLAGIEQQHKDMLAQWQSRIDAARGELRAVQAQLTAAHQQREALASILVKG